MFFDGSGKSKPAVSLRGQSKRPETKADILRKTQEQREARELAKRRNNAALKLQSHIRALWMIRSTRELCRSLFDSSWEDSSAPQDTKLRFFVFGFDPVNLSDQERSARVSQFLIDGNVLCTSSSSPESQWLVNRSLILTTFRQPLSNPSSPAFKLLAHCANLKFSQPASPWESIVSTLINAGLFSHLAAIISQKSTLDGRPFLGLSISFVASTPPTLLGKFILHILAIPRVSSQIPAQFLPPTLHGPLLDSTVALIPAFSQLDPVTPLWVLSNTLSLLSGSLPSQPMELQLKFVQFVAGVVDSCCHIIPHIFARKSDVKAVYESSSDSSDSEDEEGDAPMNPAPSLEIPEDEKLAIRSAFVYLYSADFASVVLHFMEKSGDLDAVPSLFRIMSEFGDVGRQMLNVMAFAPKLNSITRMWRFLRRHHCLSVLKEKTENVHMEDALDGHADAVAMFSMLLSHRLVVVDDEQFLDGSLLPISDILELSSCLLTIATRVLWSSKPNAHLRRMTRKLMPLLHQLYERDGRKQYCPQDHWLSAEIVPEVVIREFEASATSGRGVDELFPAFTPLHATASASAFGGNTSDVVVPEMETDAESASKTMFQNVLAVLRYLPFVIPFETRVRIFRLLIGVDAQSVQTSLRQPFFYVQGHRFPALQIHRNSLYQDAYNALAAADTALLKCGLRVNFISEDGVPEEGVGQGVTREFVQEILRESFNPEYGIFAANEENLLAPSATSDLHGGHLLHFQFAGRILGKGLYDQQIVDIPLARFFLNSLLAHRNSIADLPSLDQQTAKSLFHVKNCPPDEVESLYLHFSVSHDRLGSEEVIPLKPNGESTLVTAENRTEYVYLVANYKLNVELKAQMQAFATGLSAMIPLHWLQLFSPEELQMLISGTRAPVDVDDLEQHTVYGGGFSSDHPTIQMFWQVFREMTPEQRRELLKFATSTERAPLLGFANLHPSFCIYRSSASGEALPTASTCMNLFKLPAYDSIELLRKKVLLAIQQSSGFQFS